MRHARAESREVGGTRRAGRLAGRRIVDVGLRAAPFIAAAVVLHAVAFITWDIGSRPPQRLLADVRRAFASPASLGRGVWQLVLGTILLLAGAMLMLSVTLIDVRKEFSVLEAIAVIAGLFVEMLVGDTLRELRRAR